MSDETNMSQEKTFGQIQIADEVIAIIAATAAKEVEGVESAAGDPASSLIEFFGKKNQSKGVKVEVEAGEANIELDIAIRFGGKVQDIAAEVQMRVKSAVETMTGLTVNGVNVNIDGIVMEKPKDPSEKHNGKHVS